MNAGVRFPTRWDHRLAPSRHELRRRRILGGPCRQGLILPYETACRVRLHIFGGRPNTLIHNEDLPVDTHGSPQGAYAGFMINHPQTDMVKELLI